LNDSFRGKKFKKNKGRIEKLEKRKEKGGLKQKPRKLIFKLNFNLINFFFFILGYHTT